MATANIAKAEESPPAPAPVPVEGIEKLPAKISTGFGLRLGGKIQGATDHKKLNDVALDTIYLEARFGGTINKYFGWQANFNGKGNPAGSSGTAAVEDLILKFDLADEFHIWGGRLLVPSDRSNFSGPYFMSPWNYPGFYGANFVGPKTGANGRDDGVVAWGNLAEGKAKYFLGAFNLDDRAKSPLYSGRISVALLGTEPGFWGNSTYYGGKEILAVGAGFQYQQKGSGTVDPVSGIGTENLTNVMGDVLFEKPIPGAGTVSVEGAYYHFDKNQPIKQAFFVLGSFLIDSPVGIGKLQPLVRYQQANPQAGSNLNILDAFLTYVIHDFDLRLTAGYQRTDLGNTTANAIQLGMQIQQ